MKIEPVKDYEAPRYNGFQLKTGAKLAAGAAVMALLAGSLSGCEAYEKTMERVGLIRPEPTINIEVLVGEVPAPTNLQVEILEGDVAAPIDLCTPTPTIAPDDMSTDQTMASDLSF